MLHSISLCRDAVSVYGLLLTVAVYLYIVPVLYVYLINKNRLYVALCPFVFRMGSQRSRRVPVPVLGS